MRKTEPHEPLRILAIDDEEQHLRLIEDALAGQAVQIYTATDPEQGLELFFQEHPGVVLVDLKMPKMSGMEVLERMVARDPAAEVILMTGHYTPESAVAAIQKGAADYLTKPLNIATLRQRIADLAAAVQKGRRVTQLDRELLETSQFESIIGRSPSMLDVLSTIRRIAPHFRTALVTGATGTGKELAAHAIHRLSPVSDKTFAVCNCSALTETLYESELFGYVRGAFTGATQDKIGLFEHAQGGTVFLDEIGDMPVAGQAKLLRVLQNHEVQRVGSPVVRRIDVRVIAATNRDLRARTAEKEFREDLFYRLSMVELTLPRLADRKEDLPLLQRHFVEKFAKQFNKPIEGLTRRAQQVLARYHWPGNVRELENVIGNASMMLDGGLIDVSDLPEYISTSCAADAPDEDILPMKEMQRRYAINVVRRCGGNKVTAADMLGISRNTLYALLKEAGHDTE